MTDYNTYDGWPKSYSETGAMRDENTVMKQLSIIAKDPSLAGERISHESAKPFNELGPGAILKW